MSVEQTRSAKKTAGAFRSRLERGPDRFLAHVIEHGFAVGCQTADDFIRHFPPTTIVNALGAHPLLRAKLLVAATGVKGKIAARKSVASAAEDLRIALDESETDASTLVEHFHPDDRVRHLSARALWAYITEGRFWEASPDDGDGFEAAKSHMAYMLERALADKLLTHSDIVEGISVRTLAELLPRTELEMVIDAMLGAGRAGKPFADADLLAELPPLLLVEHIPLPLIWRQVIVSRVAEPHEYVEGSAGTHELQPSVQDAEVEADATVSKVRGPEGAGPDAPHISSKTGTAEDSGTAEGKVEDKGTTEDKAEDADTAGTRQGETTAERAGPDAEAAIARPARRKVRMPLNAGPLAARATQPDQPLKAGAWAQRPGQDATTEAAVAAGREDEGAAGITAAHPGRQILRRVRVPARAGSPDAGPSQQEVIREAMNRVQQVQKTGPTEADAGPQPGDSTHEHRGAQAAGAARRVAPPPLPTKVADKG